MTHTDLQVKVTKTSTFNGAGLDISALGPEATLVLEVSAAGPDTVAGFVFETSDDAFSTKSTGPTFSTEGGVANSAAQRFSIKVPQQFPTLPLGAASTTLRLALTRLTGTSPTITYRAFLETA